MRSSSHFFRQLHFVCTIRLKEFLTNGIGKLGSVEQIPVVMNIQKIVNFKVYVFFMEMQIKMIFTRLIYIKHFPAMHRSGNCLCTCKDRCIISALKITPTFMYLKYAFSL